MEGTNGGALERDEQKFPEADVNKELNPAENKNFEVDSVSSRLAATKEQEEEAEAARARREREKKDALQTIKNTLIVSGIVLAVAGAVFAITKKLREK
ncbi:hypothetical protein NMG60_11008483 [Bertholletia excelsa]